MANDLELLREYARGGSEAAFAEVVQRHLGLVYSAAYRHVRVGAQAEEIAQAVFILLARKAGRLRSDTVLEGWLYQTTRLTALSFLRGERRRQCREQEAYMQSTLQESPDESVWNQLAPLLDEALSRMGRKDREAVVLRFFKEKSVCEVAEALQVSEAGAHKRVSRALEKLRKFFLKRGVVSTTDAIVGAISSNSGQAVPLGLARTVTAAALRDGAAAVGGSTLVLLEAAFSGVKLKALLAIVAGALVLGIAAYLLWQPKVTRAAAAPDGLLPIKFSNDSFMVRAGGDKFVNQIDAQTRRTTNSAPAGHIQCLMAATSTGSADYLKTIPSAFAPGLTGSRSLIYGIGKDSPLFGKHVRISGWMKATDVANWAGVTLNVANFGGHIFANDSTFDRPLHGTTDWQPVAMVTDLPKEFCFIYLAPTLYGTGEIWCDDFQIDLAPPDAPVTDDRRWTVWSQDPSDYSEATDLNETRDGHTAFCIAYKARGVPSKNAFVWWGIHNRDLEKFQQFLGHTVRMSVWARSESVANNCGLNLEPKGPNGNRLADHSARNKKQIMGTTGWAEHSLTCWVPKETQDFQTGFFMFGRGKLWLDMDSFKVEIADDAPR